MTGLKEGMEKVVQNTTYGLLTSENIDNLANSLGKLLKHNLLEQKENAIEMKNHYEKTIEKFPFKSVTTAFATGVIIGLLWPQS